MNVQTEETKTPLDAETILKFTNKLQRPADHNFAGIEHKLKN